MNILLDYFFPITVINPTAQASTAFLKQACVVVKPKAGVLPSTAPVQCTSMSEVAAITDNTEAQQLFNAGLTRIFVLAANDLVLAEVLEGHEFDFYTLLISSDFGKDDILGAALIPPTPGQQAEATLFGATAQAVEPGLAGNGLSILIVGGGSGGAATVQSVLDGVITVQVESGVTDLASLKTAINGDVEAGELVQITGGTGTDIVSAAGPYELSGGIDPTPEIPAKPTMELGTFKGVVGVSSNDKPFCEAQAVIENRCAFYTSGVTGAKNLFFAFGKLLSNAVNWANQQYITMPFADDVDTIGEALNLFDKRVSFVLDDSQYGKRLGLLACGGKAIVAPYIVRNLMIDMQSKALAYIASNQPGYTRTHAALIEDECQTVIDGDDSNPGYIGKGWIEAGEVEIRLEQQNFVASGYINISEPGALWRIEGELKQTL